MEIVPSFSRNFDSDADGGDHVRNFAALLFATMMHNGFAEVVDFPCFDLRFIQIASGRFHEDGDDLKNSVVIIVVNGNDIAPVA